MRCVDGLTSKMFAERSHFYESVRAKRLLHSDGEAYHIKDIKLPVLSHHEQDRFIFTNFDDTFIKANLRYNIVQKRKKLFASVPE